MKMTWFQLLTLALLARPGCSYKSLTHSLEAAKQQTANEPAVSQDSLDEVQMLLLKEEKEGKAKLDDVPTEHDLQDGSANSLIAAEKLAETRERVARAMEGLANSQRELANAERELAKLQQSDSQPSLVVTPPSHQHILYLHEPERPRHEPEATKASKESASKAAKTLSSASEAAKASEAARTAMASENAYYNARKEATATAEATKASKESVASPLTAKAPVASKTMMQPSPAFAADGLQAAQALAKMKARAKPSQKQQLFPTPTLIRKSIKCTHSHRLGGPMVIASMTECHDKCLQRSGCKAFSIRSTPNPWCVLCDSADISAHAPEFSAHIPESSSIFAYRMEVDEAE